MSYKIRYEQEEGNIDGALQDVQALFHYGQLARQAPYAIIGFLVGVAVDGIGVSEVQHLVRDPQRSDDQLRSLLEFVSDISPYDASLKYALKTEFHYFNMTMEFLKEGAMEGMNGKGIPKTFLFLPQKTRLDFANYCRMLIHESPKLYSDMNHDYLNRLPEQPSLLSFLLRGNAVGTIMQNLMMPAIDGVLMRRCNADGNIAATRIIVACHLFQRETGRRPQALDELVPEYLPPVPLDPFDGKPFRYKPDDSIVYSVGKSLTDLGGAVWASDTPRGQQELDEVQTNPWAGDNAVFHIWE